jgi:hypothetical protein
VSVGLAERAVRGPGVYRDGEFWEVIASALGPTWDRDPTWTGPRDPQGFILPEITLGWQIIEWIEANLLGDETDDAGHPLPFRLTAEQTRFVLWWYAIDEYGIFAYREGILQRLKGWGKDPLAAVLAAVEFVGPCRFAGWATRDMPELGLERGDPVAKAHPRAWIQIAAVSKDQTRNTMTIFPGLFTAKCKAEHSIDIGKEVIYAYHAQRRIEAVTSSPRALEGGRPTFVIKNETHHWLLNNEGHEMAAVIERNSTKSKDGAARTLSITNAYEPSEHSVAQQEREAWEAEHAGLAVSTGVLYDSLEAPEDAALRPPREPGADEPTDEEVKAYLGAIVRAVRGDATWLNVDRTVASILDRKNPPSRSRRFWFNQVVASEDAWVLPAAVAAAEDPLAKQQRLSGEHPSWEEALVGPEEEVVLFFDGSKSEDSTGIVGCRLSDGYIFTVGVWQKPRGERGETWLAPRAEVDERWRAANRRFNVVAGWGDPSHAKDDDDDTRYWDDVLDGWHRDFKEHYKLWAVQSGDHRHSVVWDMTSPARTSLFVAAAERFVEEIEHLDDVEEFAPLFRHDGHPALVSHLRNARRAPGKFGVSLMKEGRESSNKIDLAVCAVGARLLRRQYLNRDPEADKPVYDNRVWGA